MVPYRRAKRTHRARVVDGAGPVGRVLLLDDSAVREEVRLAREAVGRLALAETAALETGRKALRAGRDGKRCGGEDDEREKAGELHVDDEGESDSGEEERG
jgi:hypothetical protein